MNRLYTLQLFFTALLLLIPTHAKSQAVATASGPGSYMAVGAGISGFNSDYGQQKLAGALVFVDLQPHWRVGFEGEARFLNRHNAQQLNESTYLGGVRVNLLPKPGRWNPYAKFLAGAGKITLPYGYAHGSFLAYAPGAGVELAVSDRLSVRLIDVEYQRWPQFPYGSLGPYGISTAITLRLNGISRFPKGARATR